MFALQGPPAVEPVRLPEDYLPARPRHFEVARMYLAKGSLATPERRQFVENICALYPGAKRIECPDVPHNKIDLGESAAVELHKLGKRTLVFGAHASAVRFSAEEGNACPNYWHFSPYGFCPYGCKYCYLAGTKGVWHSPTVRIYVNLPEIIAAIDRTARRLGRPAAFYLGKLQDGLALDPLTAYSMVLVPFFARHPFARQVVLTKSADVDRLLGLDHAGHTVLSWSLNPPEIAARFEENVPAIEERIAAMRRAAQAGYPVRAVLMPVVPVDRWEDVYEEFLLSILGAVPLQRLTMGGICSYRNASFLMERRLGGANAISLAMRGGPETGDGRTRYARELRAQMYAHIIRVARSVRPDLELALCLEEPEVWPAVGLAGSLGRCNCVL